MLHIKGWPAALLMLLLLSCAAGYLVYQDQYGMHAQFNECYMAAERIAKFVQDDGRRNGLESIPERQGEITIDGTGIYCPRTNAPFVWRTTPPSGEKIPFVARRGIPVQFYACSDKSNSNRMRYFVANGNPTEPRQ